ncbi:MAG: AhpC/TSA family protein [Myxococcales bacterium]|nr:AhpC/TSA family protein [Myxococcales bacterium]
MHHAIDRIHGAGAELHVIGNGAPTFIAGFRDTTGYPGPLYTDPSLEVYRAASLRRGLGTVLRPSVVRSALRARSAGFRQGATQGDALQQGGVLVIAPGGALRFRHVSRAAGDHPPVDDVVAALA